ALRRARWTFPSAWSVCWPEGPQPSPSPAHRPPSPPAQPNKSQQESRALPFESPSASPLLRSSGYTLLDFIVRLSDWTLRGPERFLASKRDSGTSHTSHADLCENEGSYR